MFKVGDLVKVKEDIDAGYWGNKTYKVAEILENFIIIEDSGTVYKDNYFRESYLELLTPRKIKIEELV